MTRRVRVEVRWLLALADAKDIAEVAPFSASARATLLAIADDFSEDDAARIRPSSAPPSRCEGGRVFIKETHRRPRRAFEGGRFRALRGTAGGQFNNLAYASMLRADARADVLLTDDRPTVIAKLFATSRICVASEPCCRARTGQTASPTTLGKESANVVAAARSTARPDRTIEIVGKINGAVAITTRRRSPIPTVDWARVARRLSNRSHRMERYTTRRAA